VAEGRRRPRGGEGKGEQQQQQHAEDMKGCCVKRLHTEEKGGGSHGAGSRGLGEGEQADAAARSERDAVGRPAATGPAGLRGGLSLSLPSSPPPPPALSPSLPNPRPSLRRYGPDSRPRRPTHARNITAPCGFEKLERRSFSLPLSLPLSREQGNAGALPRRLQPRRSRSETPGSRRRRSARDPGAEGALGAFLGARAREGAGGGEAGQRGRESSVPSPLGGTLGRAPAWAPQPPAASPGGLVPVQRGSSRRSAAPDSRLLVVSGGVIGSKSASPKPTLLFFSPCLLTHSSSPVRSRRSSATPSENPPHQTTEPHQFSSRQQPWPS
jgi:hypothetical protein